MSVLPIRVWPDPVLREVCAPVEDVTAAAHLTRDMLRTMYAAPGRGLAAPQVGIAQRLFVMDVAWTDGAPDPVICLNPEIIARAEETVTGPEGCLSIPGVTAEVTRSAWIEMAWTDEAGMRRQARLDGFAAICAQHEIDHLDGIVTFDRVAPEARVELAASYGAAHAG